MKRQWTLWWQSYSNCWDWNKALSWPISLSLSLFDRRQRVSSWSAWFFILSSSFFSFSFDNLFILFHVSSSDSMEEIMGERLCRRFLSKVVVSPSIQSHSAFDFSFSLLLSVFRVGHSRSLSLLHGVTSVHELLIEKWMCAKLVFKLVLLVHLMLAHSSQQRLHWSRRET